MRASTKTGLLLGLYVFLAVEFFFVVVIGLILGATNTNDRQMEARSAEALLQLAALPLLGLLILILVFGALGGAWLLGERMLHQRKAEEAREAEIRERLAPLRAQIERELDEVDHLKIVERAS